MGVRVKFGSGDNATPAVAEFSDDFNRANEPLQGPYYVGTEIVNLYTIVTNQLVLAASGASGQQSFIGLGAPGLVSSLSQYCAWEYIAADATNRAGGAVYLSGMPNIGVGTSQMRGYFFHVFPGTINLLGIKPGDPSYALALALGVPAANDVFELQADIGTASNRVRLWINGVLAADVTDADALRTTGYGLPGHYGTGIGGSTWDNFVMRAER